MKFWASILVVGIHVPPFAESSGTANFFFSMFVCRIGVPFFVICSGYYIGRQLDFVGGQNNFLLAKKLTAKFCKMYLFWSIVYLIVQIPDWISTGWFSAWAFVDWGIGFLRNGSYYHLWYLISMIYAIPFTFLILKNVSFKYIKYIITVLWVAEAIEYGYRLFLPQEMQRVFAVYDMFGCVAIAITRITPMLLLGITIKKEAEKNSCYYTIGFIFFFGLWFLEAVLLKRAGQVKYSYVFFTLPASLFLFKMVLGIGKGRTKNILSKRLATISTVVYFVHPLVLKICEVFVANSNLIRFAITVLVSVGCGAIYLLYKEKMEYRRREG